MAKVATIKKPEFPYISKVSREFASKGYTTEGETLESRLCAIGAHAELILGIPGYAEKFIDYASRGFYSLASPVLANFGRKRGLPVSCNGCYVDDDMEDIMYKLGEVGMQTKNGAGTSLYMGDVRAEGMPVTGSGVASGPVEFMKMYNSTISSVNQSKVRRGNIAIYLPVSHPNIMDFLEIGEIGNPIQEIHIGVCVSDEWMESMLAGDEEKRKIWVRILQKRFSNSGTPYIFFTDNVNNNKPAWFNNNKVHASNLCCMTADQRVVTSEGIKTVGEMFNEAKRKKENIVLSRTGPVNASEMMLPRPNAPIVKITTREGYNHKVTPDHKVWVLNEGWREAKDLKKGDKIEIQQVPGMFGENDEYRLAFVAGMIAGDGGICDKAAYIDITENKTIHLQSIIESDIEHALSEYESDVVIPSAVQASLNPKFNDVADSVTNGIKKKRLQSPALKRLLAINGINKDTKTRVPDFVWKGTQQTVGSYLAGILVTDSNLQATDELTTIQLASVDKVFLEEIQILLANIGVKSCIRLGREAGKRKLPSNREKGELKEYDCKDFYRLLITSQTACRIVEENTGIGSLRGNKEFLRNVHGINGYKQKMWCTFEALETLPNEDAYCLQVNNDNHDWTVNGMITKNTEIMLPSDRNHSFICVLSSLNLVHWDEILKTDAIEVLLMFLDAVNQEFITKTYGKAFMDTARRFAMGWRALGVGVFGWHSLLQSKNIAFESLEAKMLNHKVFQVIDERTTLASKMLATMFGEPEYMRGTGLRNATRMAVAPTMSSSFIFGQFEGGSISPSIEPYKGNSYVDSLAKGDFHITNPFLRRLLAKLGKDNDEVWDSITKNNGSVQHLDFLSAHEKNVFKTFSEISQKEIVIQASIRQKFIDQGQSLNIKVPCPPPDAPREDYAKIFKDVHDLLVYGWRNGIKTFYYQYNENPVDHARRQINECVSCSS